MSKFIPREPEPEVMDLAHEVEAYAHADFAEVNEAFVRRLLELARGDQSLAIDLGAGPADIPVRILRLRPRWRVVAADASSAMFAFAAERIEDEGLTRQVPLVLIDAKETPFADGTFDVVCSNSILHHINDTPPFWQELRRIARPDAVVFLRDLARPASSEEAAEIVNRYASLEPDVLQEEYYRSLFAAWTPDEVCEQLRAAGLTSLRVEMSSDRHLDVFGTLSNGRNRG